MEFISITDAPTSIKSKVRELRNSPKVKEFMYTSHEITETEHTNWLTSLTLSAFTKVFVVIRHEQLVGVTSLNAINKTQKTADWAFYLDTASQGKGLGSQVEFWMLDYAFDVEGLEKLNCEVLAFNTAVIKMHQKFGFSIEGVRRENVIKNGNRTDVVLLGITKKEWLLRRSTILPTIERLSRA